MALAAPKIQFSKNVIRIDDKDAKLFTRGVYYGEINNYNPSGSINGIEIAVYTLDDAQSLVHWGMVKPEHYSFVPTSLESGSAESYSIVFNPRESLIDAGFKWGSYKLHYNLFNDLFGSSVYRAGYIETISPSRTEIRILPVLTGDEKTDGLIKASFVKLGDNSIQALKYDDFISRYADDVITEIKKPQKQIVGEKTVVGEDPFEKVALPPSGSTGTAPPNHAAIVEIAVRLFTDAVTRSFAKVSSGAPTLYENDLESILYNSIEESYQELALPLDHKQPAITLAKDAITTVLNQHFAADFIRNYYDLDRILNFGFNNNHLIVNWILDADTHPEYPFSVVLKLYKPLPDSISENDTFWISEEMALPIEENVIMEYESEQSPMTVLGPPNWFVDIPNTTGTSTGLKSWNDILSAEESTNTSVLNEFVSSSNIVELNIDHTDYSDFVYFSSALERLNNFKYKLYLIELYQSEIDTLISTPVTSSTGLPLSYYVNDYPNAETEILSLDFNSRGDYSNVSDKDINIASSSYITQSVSDIGQVAYFSGSEFIIKNGKNARITGSLSIVFAVKPDSLTTDQVLIAKDNGFSEYSLVLNTSGGIDYYHGFGSSSGAYSASLIPSGSVSSTNFSQIGIVRSENLIYAYLDAVLVGSSSYSNDPSASIGDVYVASSVSGLASSYTGYLGKFHVYNSALTVDMIKSLYVDTWITNAEYIVDHVNLLNSKIRKVKNSFDHYEKHLYYESGSEYSSSRNFNYESSWPKYTSEKPYELYSISSSQADNWFVTQSYIADSFDRSNPHALYNLIPFHIKTDENNQDAVLFANMLGHHFDINWLYASGMTDILKREESLARGMMKDLIWYVSQTRGIELENGNELEDLWKYAFGFDRYGNLLQSGSMETLSSDVLTKEIWNRILNNLPYILKTKGTARSIKALMSCYGVPQSILKIKEYGGPDITGSFDSYYEFEDYSHAINFHNSGSLLFLDWKQVNGKNTVPNTAMLRFKTTHSVDQILLEADGNWAITLHPTTDEKGYAKFLLNNTGSTNYISASTGEFRLFDNSYYYMMIKRDSGTGSFDIDQTYTLSIKQNLGDVINVEQSISLSVPSSSAGWNSSFMLPATMSIGGLSTASLAMSPFSGSVDEVRLWTTTLSDAAFDRHVLAPSAMIGNSISASYTDLLVKLSFDDVTDLSDTGSFVANSAPTSIYTQSFISASGFIQESTEYPYNFTVEYRQNYASVPDIGISKLNSNKTRIESSSLRANTLEWASSMVNAEFDLAPIDSNRLDVYMSPSDTINEEIIAAYGGFDLNQYIGKPEDMYADTYSDLNALRVTHWNYFNPSGSVSDYIKVYKKYNRALFKQIRSLIPARANSMIGLAIEPNLLERDKYKWRRWGGEDLGYQAADVRFDTSQSVDFVYDFKAKLNPEFFNSITSEIYHIQSGSYRINLYPLDDHGVVHTYNAYLRNIFSYIRFSGTPIYSIMDQAFPVGLTFDDTTSDLLFPKHIRSMVIDEIAPVSNWISPASYIFTLDGREIVSGGAKISIHDHDGNLVIGYDETHHIHFNFVSVGFEHHRYSGCVQTSLTTTDGAPAVEVYDSGRNTLVVDRSQLGGDGPILRID